MVYYGEEFLLVVVGLMMVCMIEEGVIYDEGGFKIIVFEVEYLLIKFVYGYCFDYFGCLVVISGDIILMEFLEMVFKGVDLFLYDVMLLCVMWQIGCMFGVVGNQCFSQIVEDVQDYYVMMIDLVELVMWVEVGIFVFYYLVLVLLIEGMLWQFMDGMLDDVIVVQDGQLFEFVKEFDVFI